MSEIGEKVYFELTQVGVDEPCARGIMNYIEDGNRPGSFLYSVLTNDLVGASVRADTTNLTRLAHYGRILCWYAPSGCHGDEEAVEAWIAQGGLAGT